MGGISAEAARDARLVAALGDSSSSYYANLCKALFEAEAQAAASRNVSKHVTVPFHVPDSDITDIEDQFHIVIRVGGSTPRDRCTPRVAALLHVLDAALLEHVGVGKSTLLVDGDLVTLAAMNMEGKTVERTHCNSRVAYGYFCQDEMIKVRTTSGNSAVVSNAAVLSMEVAAGYGEHYNSRLDLAGSRVDAIVLNHFRTPIGLAQAAWLAYNRGGVVYGALPFQVEMLTQDEGELLCFPGRFYVDRVHDVITLVPNSDASMSISHPYRMLIEFIQHGDVNVAGQQYLCEKYMSVKGIVYYTINHVNMDYDAPETLRAHFYDSESAKLSAIRFPKAKLSDEGVPVGFERKEVKMLTSRLDRVLARVGTSRSKIITPSEVYVALMDYNSMVVNTLDTAVPAERMDELEQSDVAVAIALLVNWRRHQASGTLKTLLTAIQTRHSVADLALPKFAWLALSAWWSSPRVVGEELDHLPFPEVADWCGYDFSVVIQDVDPWIEMVSEGPELVRPLNGCHWLKVPDFSDAEPAHVVGNGGRSGKPGKSVFVSKPKGYQSVSAAFPKASSITLGSDKEGIVALAVTTTEVWKPTLDKGELTSLKLKLRDKMLQEQGAVNEVTPMTRIEIMDGMMPKVLPSVQVPLVDPVSAIRSDMDVMVGGLPEMDATKIGYRLAEVEVDKVTRGGLEINDSKRIIPKARFVRKPKVDLGVEGMRVQSAMALLGAGFKRNVGVPSNRGVVDLDLTPKHIVQRLINVCFVSDWKGIVQKHINAGMWEPNQDDIDSYLSGVDEGKAKKMLTENFLEGTIQLDRWKLMAKGKIKSKREPDADSKITHSQTIMFLESSSTNAMYSSITRRVAACLAECTRPNIKLNPAWSGSEAEDWYNSCEPIRKSVGRTYSYSADSSDYDRSQEHPCQLFELELYKVLGLNRERLQIWESAHGKKRAMSMMFGIVFSIVLGGISGDWKTLFRNGIINLAAVIVSAEIRREDVVTLEIKGDDMDGEFARPIKVETAVARLSLTFNLASKFHTNDVRYFCKNFRFKVGGRWIEMADPWARAQSLCTPIWMDKGDVDLTERWQSLVADLRHYDNEIAIAMLAEVTQKYYGLKIAPYGICRALSVMRADRNAYMQFFYPPEMVS